MPTLSLDLRKLNRLHRLAGKFLVQVDLEHCYEHPFAFSTAPSDALPEY